MRSLGVACSWVVLVGSVFAEGPTFQPQIESATEQAERALARFRLAPGLKAELFAAEPQLANPVAFAIDERGRFFVAETFRLHAGVTDIRSHMDWLDDDLACRTVADRLAMYRKQLGPQFDTYATEHDRVRFVEDRDGDGRADADSVFADGFHQAEVGIGAGLLARRGKVWYTCIPDLWLLEDRNGDGVADERRSLQTGYGLHVGFIGHDLHGLTMGPDGRLYFSIGDRALRVETPRGVINCPDSGAVLRCWPDGSELELFATGLRNPQELAFDDYGNLFTGDNNSDGGDKARIVHLVEGGDSGWRIGYQFITAPVLRGPWNGERLWQPDSGERAAYHLPPLLNLGDGPSGLTYYPGTGFGPEMAGRFLMCDFRGTEANSGVRSFRVKPRGASFEVVDDNQLVWSLLATDVDFAPDGAFYVSDWVEGWDLPKRGRLYRFFDPAHRAEAADVAGLLTGDWSARSNEELARLLGHADRRVRQEAQFELAGRTTPLGANTALRDVALSPDANRLARLHAVWGLGQIARPIDQSEPRVISHRDVLQFIVPLLRDNDSVVRAQVAKVLGDARYYPDSDSLRALTRDPDPQVRFAAAMALGKLGQREATDDVVAMLRDNADRDAYLRHAGVTALVSLADKPKLDSLAKDSDAAVRMAALLVMRRQGSPEVAQFLTDAEPRLISEAARAINDVPIAAALPTLAALDWKSADPSLALRVLNANFRLGQPEHAAQLAAIAGGEFGAATENERVNALELLGQWAKPSGRDWIVGLWRPLDERAPHPAGQALLAEKLLASREDRIAGAAIAALRLLGASLVVPADQAPAMRETLRELLTDERRPGRLRADALAALAEVGDPELLSLVIARERDTQPMVRSEARRILATLDPEQAVPVLAHALEGGSVEEQQAACRTLSALSHPAAAGLLSDWLQRLADGRVAPEFQLDLLEACKTCQRAELVERLAKFEASRADGDLVRRHGELLAGGDAERGREVFHKNVTAQCGRCHKVGDEGGAVGPVLSDAGRRLQRRELLESMLDPNRTIAKGFETAVVETEGGEILVGVVQRETPEALFLVSADGAVLSVAKAEIVERTPGLSAMPTDLIKLLSERDLRDLVEYLAQQTTTPADR